MKRLLIVGLFFFATAVIAQPSVYTVQNAHSHNDYEQKQPFWLAYTHQFGSIEADIFLVNDALFVAHTATEIKSENTLKNLYLEPLKLQLTKENGVIYKNPGQKLQLLIDCKTEGVPALKQLITQLQAYPEIIKNKQTRVVITGNQPNKDALVNYPSFIWFDGDLTYSYTKENLKRVALFSANFKKYSSWNGEGALDKASEELLTNAIKKAHALKKPIRFWGAPDTPTAWQVFKRLGVDYLNTDKIEALTQFLQ